MTNKIKGINDLWRELKETKNATLKNPSINSTGLKIPNFTSDDLKAIKSLEDNRDRNGFLIPCVLILARGRECETRSSALGISKQL